jgi:5-exo-hydroxycamphor dehydrogenase
MRSGRRVAFRGADQPLELWDVEVPAPEPGGVLLRVVIGGVCGSDAHRISGDMPAPPAPICFGHEGVGRIEALGEGVRADRAGAPVAVGDLVYFSPASKATVPATGKIVPGNFDLWPARADRPSPAAYQDWAWLSKEIAYYRIPEGTSPEAVIAFGCAMPTAIGGMTRLGGIRRGQSVVIQGCGPVGLASTVLAALAGASPILVIGAPEERLRAALRLGAAHVIPLSSTTHAERVKAVSDLTGGRMADVVIEAAGVLPAFGEGLELLAWEGRFLILGLYSGAGEVGFDVVALNNRSQTIIGSLGPTRLEDFETNVEIARDHGERLGFAELVTHRFPLCQIRQAIEAVGSGAAIKAVVLPEAG